MDGDDIKECNRMMIKVIIFVLLCCVDQLWSVREHGQLQSLKLRQSQSLQRLLLQSSSLVTAALLPLLTTNPHKALAVGSKSSTKKKTWVERVASKNGRVLHLGLQQDDVFYPAWFLGKWRSVSKFEEFSPPLGYEVLGGDSNLREILKTLNSSLAYESTFYSPYQDSNSLQSNIVISDRLANVKSIAVAAMGPNTTFLSPYDQIPASPELLAIKMDFLLKPPNRNSSFQVSLITTERDQYEENDNKFNVFERTRQIIYPSNNAAKLVKEIETITSYQLLDANSIVASQRTATYLSKVDGRYQRMVMKYPEIENNAVDIRFYNLQMSKLS